MTPPLDPAQLWSLHSAAIPWLTVFAAGALTGWRLARRVTRYMLGGHL